MKWVKVCNATSLSNGDLISFDYNNNNNNKKILIAKIQLPYLPGGAELSKKFAEEGYIHGLNNPAEIKNET